MSMISFIVTSYNYEKFILKTLESIKAQTYDDFEIIVVDDKSSDNSVEVVESFIAKNQHLRVTLIEHSENRGQLAAFQTGLCQAKGQFVSFIDSDDVISRDYARTHLKVHMAASVAFTSCQIFEIDENDNIHTMHSVASPQKEDSHEVKELDELLNVDVGNVEFKILKHIRFGGWHWSPGSSATFRKAAIEILLDYDTPQDWRICPDKFLFNLAHLIGGSAIIYAPLAGYRRHGSNAGNCTYVCGDKRFHSDFTTKLNIKNNLKIRPQTLKFIWRKRTAFAARFGTRDTIKLFLKVLV
jgi:glycosyltransferase involved in cell wall biosynthesis